MRHHVFVQVGPRELKLEIEGQGQGRDIQVTADDEALKVDIEDLGSGRYSILLEGSSYVVDLDVRKAGLLAHLGGKSVRAKTESALQRRVREAEDKVGASQPSGESISAPIAGKVVKIHVALGDKVCAGQPVVVLEAMKMENELKAESGGVVKSIAAKVGESVETAQILVELG